jgi:predicted permease
MTDWLKHFAHRFRSSFANVQTDQDFESEMSSHIEFAVEENLRRGMTPQDARRAALVRFGGREQATQQHREARGFSGFGLLAESVWQDLRYGLRMLLKKPGFTTVAVLTLVIGVGANTTIFSIVNAVLLRRLPYREPDRLVKVIFSNPGVGLRDIPASIPEYEDLKTRSNVFEDVCGIGGGSVNLTGGSQPERLDFVAVLPNYFSMLGATPQIGRLFGPQDFALGFAPVVVISDGLWHRAFGADRNVLGRTLRLDNDAYTVIGVLPPGFRHPEAGRDVEAFLTAGFSDDPAPKPARSTRVLPAVIGRLKPGITLAQAQARLTALAAELRHDFPTDYPAQAQWTIEIQPLQEAIVGPVRPMLLVLLGAVILIVLIVSLNLANLLLARASGRQQEMAVRQALGASRGRMVRQMLTESLLLSGLGGTAGVLTAYAVLGSIVRFVPANIPRLNDIRIDWVVLGFALSISLVTGLVFGLAPALHSAKVALSSAIREGARGSGYSVKTGRLRDALIVAELSFAVMLMVGAGLLLRTLRDLLHENPGFNPEHVVTANMWLPVPNDPKADPYNGLVKQAPFNRELLRRMKTIPGVDLAAITADLPTVPYTPGDVLVTALTIEDRPLESSQDLRAEGIRVSTDYFKLMQVPLVRGRFFTDGDEDGKEAVAIIDEATARRYWPDRDPIGRRLRFGQDPAASRIAQVWRTVVGVVKDVRQDGLDMNGIPHIYVPVYQYPGRSLTIVLRTSLPASMIEPQIRHEVQSIDSGLPIFHVYSMDDVLDASLAPRRFSADLISGFAGLALLLASVGIYGLLAYMVGQRSREIGIRMALGARREDILKLILGKGFILAAVGIVMGILLAASGASAMATLLYGVRPHDPLVFMAVPVLLLFTAVSASYIPARRAAKVDPVTALREA